MNTKIYKIALTLFILALPFVIPYFNISENEALLTAIALLFAILIGFFIATATSNYLRLQTLIADANACLISIRNLVKRIDPLKKKDIENAIDEYMIATLDYEFLDFVAKTRTEFNTIINVADETTPSSDVGYALISELHSRMDDLLTNDQEIALTSKPIVTNNHWFIIGILTTLLTTALLSFRDESFFMSLFIGVMLLSIYHILVLIYHVDNNIFLGTKLSFESPQQVFMGIDRHHYYPEYAIKNGYAKPSSNIYRLGIYKNYPASFEKEVVLVEPK